MLLSLSRMTEEAQRERSVESVNLKTPSCWPYLLLTPSSCPALTLNSVGTKSFGVARPRKASRPQPSRMARTEEKSLNALRTWPQSGRFSLGLPSHFRFTLSRLQTGSRAQTRHFTQKGKMMLTTEGKKRLFFTYLRAMAQRKEVKKRRREKKAMSGTV